MQLWKVAVACLGLYFIWLGASTPTSPLQAFQVMFGLGMLFTCTQFMTKVFQRFDR